MKLNNINLNNENYLLLATCRPAGKEVADSLSRFISGEQIEWDDLLFKAGFHRVIPAVYNNLSEFFRDIVPEKYLEKFKNEYLEISKKSLFLSSVLIDLLRKLGESGIKALTFKGPALSYLLHQDITLREFSDLDIFISKDDLDEVFELMRSWGYKAQFELSDHYKDYYENSHYYYMNFIREDKKAVIDVHWATSVPNYSFSNNLEYFENRLVNIELLGYGLSILSKEDMLLELSVHGARHSWSRLGWICDIAELCDPVREADIKSVIGRSKDLKCCRIVCNALLIADRFFNCIEPSLKEYIRNFASPSEYKQVFIFGMIFPDQFRFPSVAKQNLFFPFSMDSFRDKFLYFYNNYLSPTPLEFSIVRLNRSMFMLYYPLRMIRLFYRLCSQILSR